MYVPDSDSEEEDGKIRPPQCPAVEYMYEGLCYAKRRQYKEAITCFEKALELQPNDERTLIARSKCLLQIGENEKAFEDAETALAKNPDNVRAIYQKAEALYMMGNFEFALVYYQRGLKLRPDMEMFRLGVQNAQEAIRSSIGAYTKIKLNKKQIDQLRVLQSQKVKNRMFQNDAPPKIMPSAFDVNLSAVMADKMSDKRELQEERLLLGLLARDKEFCRSLSQNEKLSDIDAHRGQELTALAEEVVKFLNVRQEFWRQQKPVNPILKKSEIVRRVHLQFRPSGGINANLPNILQRVREKLATVQAAEKANHWDTVLRESHEIQRLLLPVKFSLWPSKADVLCAAYCAMGKACVHLDLLEVGLACHLKGLDIATARNLPMARDIALEHLGSTYVCLRMFDKAIEVWRLWLPRCTNHLLRAWLLHELGHCHLELGEVEEAKECGRKAMECAIDGNDKIWLLNAIILVTQCEVKTGYFRNGASLMERAVDIAEEVKFDDTTLALLTNIKDKVSNWVNEAYITVGGKDMTLFQIAEEETRNLFSKDLLKRLSAKLEKVSQETSRASRRPKLKKGDGKESPNLKTASGTSNVVGPTGGTVEETKEETVLGEEKNLSESYDEQESGTGNTGEQQEVETEEEKPSPEDEPSHGVEERD